MGLILKYQKLIRFFDNHILLGNFTSMVSDTQISDQLLIPQDKGAENNFGNGPKNHFLLPT